jgi:large subunit ribosomal protein L35
MPKQKTHKGLKKRVKITASGKVKHKRPNCGHLMSGKSAKRKRRLNTPALMNKTMARTAKIELGK